MNLLENESDDFMLEIPFSEEILNDLLNGNYNEQNYETIIKCMDFFLMDMEYYNEVIYKMIDIHIYK